ncbi:MAG: FAD-dependent oxidoreductase [Spirochaetales bacterium]|nr:FAD-dependent oxidoreductase [Spirochaetales bacterium]
MVYKELSFKLSPGYTQNELRETIAKKAGRENFSFEIIKKSLDARRKKAICWNISVRLYVGDQEKGVFISDNGKGNYYNYRKRKERVVVSGNAPGGMFPALLLQKAGFNVTLLERGMEVDLRSRGIDNFERTGKFNSKANYAFGEGGAGTFSDGKLTARSKKISGERSFIIDAYIRAGAPEEIRYLAHPHLGSDNLKPIVKNLRKEFISDGGQIRFESFAENLAVCNSRVKSVQTGSKEYQSDFVIAAPGHSAYDTYRMLMGAGVGFKVKNYAIGSRIEHPQVLINEAQWGVSTLPGVKAAEYRLTSNIQGSLPVYTFCMCPGGAIVPATACEGLNIVNGMSNYARDGAYANSACVAAVNLEILLGKTISPEEALFWTESLERKFYIEGYKAPGCSIEDFLKKSSSPSVSYSSTYPFDIIPSALWEILPERISNSMRLGLKEFSSKLKGFETGTMLGLESKTSAPIQVLRRDGGLCDGFSNLYICGEGSGFAGGIISSAVDGLKTAGEIIVRCSR